MKSEVVKRNSASLKLYRKRKVANSPIMSSLSASVPLPRMRKLPTSSTTRAKSAREQQVGETRTHVEVHDWKRRGTEEKIKRAFWEAAHTDLDNARGDDGALPAHVAATHVHEERGCHLCSVSAGEAQGQIGARLT